MIDIAVTIALVCIGVALLLNAWRLLKGPGRADRILALDTMTINGIAAVILFGIQTGKAVHFEAALLLAMVGFVGTVAYARFILRGDIVE